MCAEVVADFAAQVTTDGLGEAPTVSRILLGTDRLVVTAPEQRTVPLTDIFDVTRGDPRYIDVGSASNVTIAYRSDDSPESLTFGLREERAEKFLLLLFVLLLKDTETIVSKPSTGDDAYQPPARGTLSVTKSKFTVDGDNGFSLPTAEIKSFKRLTTSDGQTRSETVRLCFERGRTVQERDVTLPSSRLSNIFARFIRERSDATTAFLETVSILLIDDEPGYPELLARHLEAEGERVETVQATDGVDALEKLEDNPQIDYVVSDYQMPRIDGLSLLKAIREARPNLPFALVTAHPSQSLLEKAIRAGLTDFLSKAEDPSETASDLLDIIAEQYPRVQSEEQTTQPHA